MNKELNEAIDRLRALPEERQQEAAYVILDFLESDEDDLLTPEQWAEIEKRLQEDEVATDAEVQAAFRRARS